MHGAFCDQLRPGNVPGDNPDLSCTVPSGDTAHAAHAVRLPDVLRRCGTLPRCRKLFFRYFAGGEKKSAKRGKKDEIQEFSSKREKNVQFITTLGGAEISALSRNRRRPTWHLDPIWCHVGHTYLQQLPLYMYNIPLQLYFYVQI